MMKHYRIDELLTGGEQWFGGLDHETFDALANGVAKHGDGELPVPIVISERGRLLDGHQRLMGLQRAGRKMISEADVRVDHTATDAESEALASISYQFTRRHLTSADKAKLTRDLMHRFNWSLGTVATNLGVSRPAVSKWLRENPDPSFHRPDKVTGTDGKSYTVSQEPEPTAKRPRAQPDYSPTRVVDDYTLQLCNPGWGQWIGQWALLATAEEKAEVASNLRLIATSCEMLAEGLEQIPSDSEKPSDF